MRAAYGLSKQGLADRIVGMEADISCIAGPPGGFRVTVERPRRTLERGERLARGVAVNLDGRIGLGPGIRLVPPGCKWRDLWSLGGGASG